MKYNISQIVRSVLASLSVNGLNSADYREINWLQYSSQYASQSENLK